MMVEQMPGDKFEPCHSTQSLLFMTANTCVQLIIYRVQCEWRCEVPPESQLVCSPTAWTMEAPLATHKQYRLQEYIGIDLRQA